MRNDSSHPSIDLLILVIGLLLCLSAGCEKADRWERMPVGGRATLDGKPWSGSLALRPVRPVIGPTTSIEVNEGTFQFSRSDGPVAGQHQAILMPKSEFGRQDEAFLETLVEVPAAAPLMLQLDFVSPPPNDVASPVDVATEPDVPSK